MNDSPLSAAHTASLTGLTLHYNGSKQRRWAISSAIAFVGSEQTCSVALPEHPNVSRIHGVFVRTPRNVYFVDLASRGTLLNGKRIYNESIELHHNDTLSIGQRGLRVQLARKPLDDPNHFPMDEAGPYTAQASPKFNTDDPQVMMAALLTQIQKQHDTALERQNEMQVAIAQLLRQVQNEQSRTLEKHLERIQHLDLEIATLKSTIQTEESPRKKLEDIPSQTVTTITPPLLKQPSAAPEPARPAPQPAAELPGDLDASPEYTTAWLLDRVSQLDQEQTSVWKEMLGRFLGR